MTIDRPILRYHGGKWLLASWILSHFPPHRVYTEVFGGAASVIFQKPRSYAEVYNDRWDTVVNVFRVLRDPMTAAELRRRIELTPFARDEFEGCGEVQIRECDDPIEKARLTIFRSFAGFGSAATNAEHSTGFRANTTRSGTTPAHDWVNYPTHIKSFTERLRGVVIENRDYHDVFKAHDGPETLHYVDPPYVHATRNMQRGNAAYAHEFTDDDHRQLSEVLHGLSGMVVLSGYDSELYSDLFGDWGGGDTQGNARRRSNGPDRVPLAESAMRGKAETIKTIPMLNINAKDKTGPNYLELLPKNTVWCFEANDDTASLRAHRATEMEHGTYLESIDVSVEVDQAKQELYDRFRMPDNDRAALRAWFEFQNKNILEI